MAPSPQFLGLTVAFLGVVVALIFQVRQASLQRVVSLRQHHIEILKTSIENPEYEQLIYGEGRIPLYSYVNLMLQNIYLFWRVDEINESEARWELVDLFDSAYTRRWWNEKAREVWALPGSSRRQLSFVAIVDEDIQARPT